MLIDKEFNVSKPVLRYHGAKFRLASWILGFFPEHRCYVEPFGGAAGVLLQKPRSYGEVYNDLDKSVSRFFEVLQSQEKRDKLIESLILTPYSRDEFERAWDYSSDEIEDARRMCIRAQMGFGSAGATKGNTGFRVDTKRDYGTAQQLWVRFPDQLAAAGSRLTGVVIENRPAIDVMRQHDGIETLHFVDPPYMFGTRVVKKNCSAYRHEMTDMDHEQLLDCVLDLDGFVVLSGYDSDLYNDKLSCWEKRTTSSRASSSRGTVVRSEVVWVNPACSMALAGEIGQIEIEL